MFSRSSHRLSIRSPSSTTISYTVSDRLHPASRILTPLKHAIRVILISYVLLADLAKVQSSFNISGLDSSVEILLNVSLIGSFIRGVAKSYDWWVLLLCTASTLWLCLRRDYTGRIS